MAIVNEKMKRGFEELYRIGATANVLQNFMREHVDYTYSIEDLRSMDELSLECRNGFNLIKLGMQEIMVKQEEHIEFLGRKLTKGGGVRFPNSEALLVRLNANTDRVVWELTPDTYYRMKSELESKGFPFAIIPCGTVADNGTTSVTQGESNDA
ncbi:hypothetical protein [Vibrio phage PH669]|uniref:Uncharacterized protein n=1 Tax=Vibrio phage PH669 TaxID=2800823 RepID=A0A7T6ZN46_9CAUD|nr:hypothetical protein [Vibrio phage PH669]